MNFYYVPGAGKINGQRLTLLDRIRIRRIRKRAEKSWRWLQ